VNQEKLGRELEEIVTKMKKFIDSGESGETGKSEFQALRTRAFAIKAELEDAFDRKDRDDLSDFLERPKPKFPLPSAFNGDHDGRKALRDQGWELKGGVWNVPTSLGPVPMFPNDVLFGEVPVDDPVAGAYFKQTRAAMQPEYKAAYTKHLVNSIRLRDGVMAYAQLTGLEQKALSEGSDTAGGMLVPPDYQAEVLARLGAYSMVRKAGARVQPTSRDTLRYPMVNAAAATEGGLTAGGDSIFAGGFVGSWAGETPAFTDKDATFTLFQVLVKKLRCVTKLGNDFVADSAVDVIAWLARNGAENMALVEDLGFISGDGTALKPKGILNNGATQINVAGSTANTISNTTSNQGSAPKLIKLWQALPPQYDVNAVFGMSKGTEGAIRALTDAQSRFLWPAFMAGGFAAPGAGSPGAPGAASAIAPRDFQGRPVLNSQFLIDGSVANAGLLPIIYGDFSQYVIAQRAQISTVILRERFADTDQTGIILFERVGGDTYNIDGFRFGVL
jgi:HK97 family phage major capsid protein